MKKDCDDYFSRDINKIHKKGNIPQEKVNILLEELIEKEEETTVYKNRLKELETAFYYNLDVIAERDLELSVLEKKLSSENEQLQEIISERDELQDLLKVIDEKNNRKTQQLETKLSFKDKEIVNLKRENIKNVNTFKRVIDDLKQQQEKKIRKMIEKFETHKNEIKKTYMEEVEKTEKFYLLQIDNLNEKLEQVGELLHKEKDHLEEAEQEKENLKYHLQEAERIFLQKENQYLHQIKKLTFSQTYRINAEVQCDFKHQSADKTSQAKPETTTAFAQTNQNITDSEREYINQINFLQEQNEVLKYIVKDLKRNQGKPENLGQPPGCECLALKTELENLNKKFENEISNLKDILEEEQKQRKEEDEMIQNLEKSVCCLKDKLLLGLQEKLNQFSGLQLSRCPVGAVLKYLRSSTSGEDICAYTCNREIQNEIQIALLEEKLSKKIDSLISMSESERQKIQEKLEQLKKECVDQIEKYLKTQEAPTEFKSENILEKIRFEIQKLENKIKTDMKNIVINNTQMDKCGKSLQSHPETNKILNCNSSKHFPQVLPSFYGSPQENSLFCNLTDSCGVYYKNDLSHENFNPENI